MGSMCFFMPFRANTKKEYIMPQNNLQRFIYAELTVPVTVHAYVFYSLYVVNGDTLMAAAGAHSVLDAI